MKRSGSKRRRGPNLTPAERIQERRVANSKRTIPHGGAMPPRGYQPTAGGHNPNPLPWERR